MFKSHKKKRVRRYFQNKCSSYLILKLLSQEIIIVNSTDRVLRERSAYWVLKGQGKS